MLEESLKQQGYKVDAFADIASAIIESSAWQRLVVVTAEQLPDGYFGDLISQLEQQPRILSTIVTSHNGTVDRAVEAFKHGAQDFLVEPYSSFELSNIIQRALSKANEQMGVMT